MQFYKRKATKTFGPYPGCRLDWCSNEAANFGGGLCSGHDLRRRKGRPLDTPLRGYSRSRVQEAFCSQKGCNLPAVTKRMCARHYGQWARGAKAEAGAPICALAGCLSMTHRGNFVCLKHRELARKYGMSPEQIAAFWRDGCCQLCGSTYKPSIDHDHSCCPVGNDAKCGKCNRGLLCHNCNLAAGYAQDSPDLLRSLAAYLEGYAAIS